MGRNDASSTPPPWQHPAIDQMPPEETPAQADSFVVRIWRQAGAVDPQCRGWIEHVQSGKRTSFLGLERLPAVIAAHIGIPIHQGEGWRDRLRRWRDRVTHRPEHAGEEQGGEIEMARRNV